MVLLGLKKECPQCGSSLIRRSSRRGEFEKRYLPFVLLSPFRCKTCGLRFLGLYLSLGLARKREKVYQVVTMEKPPEVPVFICGSRSRPIHAQTDLVLGRMEPSNLCGVKKVPAMPQAVPLLSRSAGGSC
jgi:predicted RNA-binding Zn-ribbon protein involved in translation (DUF1610 family)